MLSSEKPLGCLAEILAGIPNTGQTGDHPYKIIQPNSFSNVGELDALETQSREEELSPKQLLSPGDILVKRLNPSFVYVVRDEDRGAVASQNLLVVRPGPEIDPLYLACLLEQKELVGQVEHVSGTAAAIKAISQKKLAEIMIPVVPLAEQKKLGEIWRLSRKRKALLREYITESDRLVAMMTSKITTGGGEKK
ncbi:MAG: restriction endonuclease subunit S [Oscillospiraceae bacterium]|nr:restriction endonuclease subunit S [Oscillospiraceae bacterium]